MGLGKTIQVISFLQYLYIQRRLNGPFLIVAPLSTLQAWKREFAKWAPEMNVVVYVGDQESRDFIFENEIFRVPRYAGTGASRRRASANAKKQIAINALLTTYEFVNRDTERLRSIKWLYLAVDEAQRLKDSNSMLYRVRVTLGLIFCLCVS